MRYIIATFLLVLVSFFSIIPIFASTENIQETGYSIRIGPNPMFEDFNIIVDNHSGEFIGSRDIEVKMYNTAGNIVLEETFYATILPGEQFYKVSTRGVHSGIYTIRVQVGRTQRRTVEFYKIGGNVWGSFER